MLIHAVRVFPCPVSHTNKGKFSDQACCLANTHPLNSRCERAGRNIKRLLKRLSLDCGTVCVRVSADKHFWVQGYTLISKDVEDCVPIFLRHFANDVYVCGKNINLLRICCPQVGFTFWRHFILLFFFFISHSRMDEMHRSAPSLMPPEIIMNSNHCRGAENINVLNVYFPLSQ